MNSSARPAQKRTGLRWNTPYVKEHMLLPIARLVLELNESTRAVWTKGTSIPNGTLYVDQYFNRNATPYKLGAPQLRTNT